MPSNSIWLLENKQEFKPLEGGEKAGVCIVGGGLSGLTTAYYLAKDGVDVVVLEAKTVGRGASGHNSAHLTCQHDYIYSRLAKYHSFETAKAHAKANNGAILSIKKIIDDEHIDCDFAFVNSYMFTNQKEKAYIIEEESRLASRLGIEAEIQHSGNFIFPYAAAARYKNQAIFHPVKYVNGLAKAIVKYGGRIYENSRVLNLEKGRVKTDKGTVTAPITVIATHFPLINFPGMFFARSYQSRSYCIALNNVPNLHGMWHSIETEGKSYRMYKDLMIIAYGEQKTGTNLKTHYYKELDAFVKKHFTPSKIEYNWSAQDVITCDELPYIGHYSGGSDSLYAATGFRKWGLSQSNVAGQVISDLITGRKNDYAPYASPQRRLNLVGFLNLLAINLSVAGHYAQGLVSKDPKCSHMKCGLKFNEDECSWDCPCHGSRFETDGTVIETPAIHDVKMDDYNT